MTYVSSFSISQLGCGAGYALWGFRAAAIGHLDCCALTRGYDGAFGAESASTRGAVLVFARIIGSVGRRRIMLGAPGCGGVTCDELSIIAVLAAAQARQPERRDAHLLWLLARRGCETASAAADAVALRFTSAGLAIKAPPIELHDPKKAKPLDIDRTLANAPEATAHAPIQ